MHTNPDLLALLALGEDVGAEDDLVHISGCQDCRTELAAFTAAAGTGRRTTEVDLLVAPRPEVWQRISRELNLTERAANGSTTAALRPPPVPVPSIGTTNQRSVRAAALALAAVLALAVGIGLGLSANRVLPGQREVATVQLNALPSWAGSEGRAVIEQDRDGNRTLVVEMNSPEPATGPREVWIGNSKADNMIAMGYLDQDSGRFPIRPDVDLAEFPLIDISQEPPGDDDFRHSGESMLRGKLPV